MPKYDVAVIGAGLGGLTAAALLSGKKKKTLIIDQGASLSDALGVVEKDGFTFSAGPSLSYGFERGGAFQELLSNLGIVQQATVKSPCYQIALSDRRITVFQEHDETLEELRREYPKEIIAISRFYREIDKIAAQMTKNRISAFLAKRRSAAGFIGTYGFSSELTAFFDIQSLFFFQKPAANLSLAALITLCNTPPRHLHGGFRKVCDQLYGVILQHGGEVRYNERSPTLFFRDNRVTGIQTMQGIVEVDTIVLNTLPLQHTSMLLVGLMDDAVIPSGMCSDVLFLPEYSHPQEFLVLSLNAGEDRDLAPKGMRALSALFKTNENVPADKQMLIGHLRRVIPFLDDYLMFADEYKLSAGHAVLPVDVALKRPRSKEGTPLFCRTSKKNVYVLRDAPDAPLQVIAAVQRFVEKMK